jgi:hypothetical protein
MGEIVDGIADDVGITTSFIFTLATERDAASKRTKARHACEFEGLSATNGRLCPRGNDLRIPDPWWELMASSIGSICVPGVLG